MNTFDIAVIVIITFCLIRGLFKGLIGEVSGTIGVVAGFYGAYTYYPLIVPYIEPWIQIPEVKKLVSFFLLFCAILMIIGIVSLLIQKILNLVFLGWVDRTFGLIFGAAKGLLIVSVLFIMITTFLPKETSLLTDSKFSPDVARVSKAMTVFIAKNTRQDFYSSWKEFKKMETIDRLFDIIRTLRSENGCVWDRQQTPETMWKCLVEETYELEEAIAKKTLRHICEELGDVLFQLVFLLEMFQERQAFTLSDVVEQVAKKMIRRHPHVYEDACISNEKELNQQWDAIKALENEENGQTRVSVLDTVPKGMPSLIRALKVSKCAVKEGFDWDTIHDVLNTTKDEIAEFEAALTSKDQNAAMMEFGDILFSLVNVARFANFHPEVALAVSTAKFEGRFKLMEIQLKKKQVKLKDLSRHQKDLVWEQAKQSYDT